MYKIFCCEVFDENTGLSQIFETLHVNCLEPRAYFIPFADEKTAASRERSESDYFVPLCGEWDFRFFKSFEDVLREPPEYVGGGRI